MTKSDIHVLFNHFHLQSVLTSQKASTTFLTTRLKRMASLASVLAMVAFLTFFCLFFQSGASTADSDDLQRVQRSLLGVPSPSVASRFSLWQKQNIADNKNEVVLPASIKQSDIFISVKTTKQFHHKRLDLILKTWFQLARDDTWFFTDDRDQEFDIKTNGHLRVTECSSLHSRQALCCKMAAEFDAFLESTKKWFCHFDDDNYVNVPALLRKLQDFDYQQDWYLGKPSIPEPLEILDRDNMQHKLKFWFATGGAGFCLSRSLATKMLPIAGGGKFETVGDKIRLPDDVTMGYIAEHMLKTPLTVIEEFHSHLEPQRFISLDKINDQISFSYSKYGEDMNVVDIGGLFSEMDDPTRFKSLHCTLFPNFSWCPREPIP